MYYYMANKDDSDSKNKMFVNEIYSVDNKSIGDSVSAVHLRLGIKGCELLAYVYAGG